jgi:hypothetical protein
VQSLEIARLQPINARFMEAGECQHGFGASLSLSDFSPVDAALGSS